MKKSFIFAFQTLNAYQNAIYLYVDMTTQNVF